MTSCSTRRSSRRSKKTGYEFSGWEILPVNGKTFDPANDAVAESLIVRATYEGLPFTVEAGHVDNIKYLKASSGANSNDLLEGDKLTAKAGADVLVRFAAERDWAITGIAIVGLDGSKTIVEPILRTKEKARTASTTTNSASPCRRSMSRSIFTPSRSFPSC